MINILPYNQKKMIHRVRLLRIVTTTIIAFIFLVLIAVVLLLPLLVAINSRFGIANDQIAELEKTGAVVSESGIADLSARTNTLREKLASTLPTPPTEYVAVVRTSAPSGITLNSFSMALEKPVLTVAGTASTRDTLQQFIAVLKNNPMIATVDSPVSNFVKSTNSQFTITITFK